MFSYFKKETRLDPVFFLYEVPLKEVNTTFKKVRRQESLRKFPRKLLYHPYFLF